MKITKNTQGDFIKNLILQSNSNAKDRFEYHVGLEYHHIKEYNEDNIRFDNY